MQTEQMILLTMARVVIRSSPWAGLIASVALACSSLMPAVGRADQGTRRNGRNTIVQLYDTYAVRIEKHFERQYLQAVHDGLADTPANKQQFLKAFFVFSLIRDQGILGNLWELVDSYPAGDDRMPATMFKEAFSQRAVPTANQQREQGTAQVTCVGYSHGRCDRLEMEFIALLSFLGVKSEMFMAGPIHVRTEVPIGGHYLIFDNSFSRFRLLETPGVRVRPAKPYSVKYANQLAHSQAERISKLTLDLSGVTRVEQAIERFLAGQEPTWCAGATNAL